jgi:hypothetical protein
MGDVVSGVFTVVAELDEKRRALPASKRRSARPVTEDAVKASVLNKIKTHPRGGYAICKHQTGTGERGTPDVLACMGGRMVVVEVKRSGNIPEPKQLGELRRWQLAGALACWVDDAAQLDDVFEHLDELNWRNDFAHPGDGRHANAPW